MTFVRNVLADLVAKRLWPVAVLLVVAMVALPVLVAGSGDDPLPIPAADADPVGSAPLVAVAAEGDARTRSRTGSNPFTQRHLPATDAPAAPGAAGAAPASTGGGATGSAGGGIDIPGGLGDPIVPLPGLDDIDVIPVGGGSGGGSGAGSPGGTLDSYTVDLRVGRDGRLESRKDVARLSPLPDEEDPFFVYLGVEADGETAIFLVSSDAKVTGDGVCKPSPKSCERVHMKAGDTEFFDVVTPEGETLQYQLDLVRVARQRSATQAMAVAERSEESPEGREVLRHAVDSGQVDISHLRYSSDLGVVVETGSEDPRATTELFAGFRVDLRFGAPGALVKRYHLARLTPLPSVDEPSLVFLGVMGDGRVIFLNPTSAHESGDGECVPSDAECHRVLLRDGERSVLDVPTIDGRSVEYEIVVDDVRELGAATSQEADLLLRRESPQGRVILRRLIAEVAELAAGLSYSPKSGTVVEK